MPNLTVAPDFGANLANNFYDVFGGLVDNYADITVAGTATAPENLTDNDTATMVTGDLNQTVTLTFDGSVYMAELRYYGRAGADGAGKIKLQANIDGTWTDASEVPSIGAAWSAWIPVTALMASAEWRVIFTVGDGVQGYTWLYEIELKGVKIG